MTAAQLTDETILSPPRELAEAVRDLLDGSPSDVLIPHTLGSLRIQRAWLPIFRLEEVTETVISVLVADDTGELNDRAAQMRVECEIDVSVQKLIAADPHSEDGKSEIDAVVDFAERVLRGAFQRVIDASGRVWTPTRYERTIDDDALLEWNQATVLFTVNYATIW